MTFFDFFCGPSSWLFRKTSAQRHKLLDLIEQYQRHECAVPYNHIFGFLPLSWNAHNLTVAYDQSPLYLLARVINQSVTRKLRSKTEQIGRMIELDPEILVVNYMTILGLDWCPKSNCWKHDAQCFHVQWRHDFLLACVPNIDLFFLLQPPKLEKCSTSC